MYVKYTCYFTHKENGIKSGLDKREPDKTQWAAISQLLVFVTVYCMFYINWFLNNKQNFLLQKYMKCKHSYN